MIARDRRISLDFAVPDEPTLALGDVTLLERALSNVVHNAVRYNDAGGHVAVVLSAKPRRDFHPARHRRRPGPRPRGPSTPHRAGLPRQRGPHPPPPRHGPRAAHHRRRAHPARLHAAHRPPRRRRARPRGAHQRAHHRSPLTRSGCVVGEDGKRRRVRSPQKVTPRNESEVAIGTGAQRDGDGGGVGVRAAARFEERAHRDACSPATSEPPRAPPARRPWSLPFTRQSRS
jgi:hypothetical protein